MKLVRTTTTKKKAQKLLWFVNILTKKSCSWDSNHMLKQKSDSKLTLVVPNKVL